MVSALRRSRAIALGTCMLIATALATGVAGSVQAKQQKPPASREYLVAVRTCRTYGRPAWSPDGSRIAFGALNADGSGGLIETVTPAGTDLRALTEVPPDLSFDDFDPTWSPDGKRLAFVRARDVPNSAYPDWSLNLLDSPTGVVTQVADLAANPTWSRTGLLGYQLFDPVLDFAGFVAGPRTFLNPSDAVELAGPSWSPDGSRFAFEADHYGANTVTSWIYVMNRNGRRRQLVAGSGPSDLLPAGVVRLGRDVL